MEIALLRFQRTSTLAGTQLVKFAKRGAVPWARWYKFETEVQTKDVKRWFIIKAAPVEEPSIDEHEKKFCDLMCTIAERDYLYPRIARQYAQASGESATPVLVAENPVTSVTDADAGDFGPAMNV
jgi:hypothetical protein